MRKLMDQNNFNHKLIIAALAGMVEDDGLTPHEAFAVLEDIKRNTFHALAEIHREVKK
ncbi:hypothetical protein PV433_25985 [Paenibacillus sp. GYB004]|uniref:hypothetical protein n=1 Tax=Paenibacillus sp. GYB004 TaxID=2994393 RepID=UPI002F96900A